VLDLRQVGCRECGDDARMGTDTRQVHLRDPRVPMGAADEYRMQHVGKHEIVEVEALTADQLGVLDPLDPRADVA